MSLQEERTLQLHRFLKKLFSDKGTFDCFFHYPLFERETRRRIVTEHGFTVRADIRSGGSTLGGESSEVNRSEVL